jgi:hypothetical protein
MAAHTCNPSAQEAKAGNREFQANLGTGSVSKQNTRREEGKEGRKEGREGGGRRERKKERSQTKLLFTDLNLANVSLTSTFHVTL